MLENVHEKWKKHQFFTHSHSNKHKHTHTQTRIGHDVHNLTQYHAIFGIQNFCLFSLCSCVLPFLYSVFSGVEFAQHTFAIQMQNFNFVTSKNIIIHTQTQTKKRTSASRCYTFSIRSDSHNSCYKRKLK